MIKNSIESIDKKGINMGMWFKFLKSYKKELIQRTLMTTYLIRAFTRQNFRHNIERTQIQDSLIHIKNVLKLKYYFLCFCWILFNRTVGTL